MARRPAIDRDEFFEAANRLQAEGKEVTASVMLDALGGGSLRTIYKYLGEWQQEQPHSPSSNRDTELPEPVLMAFKATWRAATTEADRATAAIREQAAEEVKAAQRQFSDALDAIEKLEKQGDIDTKTIEELTAKVTELEGRVNELQEGAAADKATIEELRQQAGGQQKEADRLRTELERERKEKDAAIREAAELKGTAATLKAQNDTLITKLGSGKGK
ncbi:MAG: DNA-binding protein [Candidatus Obscuribacterales bacterium]